MNEVKFLIDQIKTTFNGDSWHGPNLVQTLKGIDVKQAKKKILDQRHTIWELVDHNTHWINEVGKAVKDRKDLFMGGEHWPKMGETVEDWQESIRKQEVAVNTLLDTLTDWTNEDLKEKVGDTQFTYKQMLHGLIHHNLYHAGQIMIMKKK